VAIQPAVEQEYKLLTRDHQTALDFYNDLLKKHDQSSMSQGLEESEQAEHFRVLDPANFPDQPSFPKVPFFLGEGLLEDWLWRLASLCCWRCRIHLCGPNGMSN